MADGDRTHGRAVAVEELDREATTDPIVPAPWAQADVGGQAGRKTDPSRSIPAAVAAAVRRPGRLRTTAGLAVAAGVALAVGFAVDRTGAFDPDGPSAEAGAPAGPVALVRPGEEPADDGSAAEVTGDDGSSLTAGRITGPDPSSDAAGEVAADLDPTGTDTTPDPAQGTPATTAPPTSRPAPTTGGTSTSAPTTTGPQPTVTTPGDPGAAAFAAGVAAFERGAVAEAIDHLDEAVALDPDHPEAFIYRSLAHRTQGRFDQAVADGDRAVANAPGNGDAYLNRGIALAARGEPRAALIDLDRAVALKPSVTAFVNRGLVHEDLGDPVAAIADYGDAIARAPSNPDPHWFRGNAHGRTGALAAARTDLLAFLDRAEVSHPNRAEAERLVAEVELGNNPFG